MVGLFGQLRWRDTVTNLHQPFSGKWRSHLFRRSNSKLQYSSLRSSRADYLLLEKPIYSVSRSVSDHFLEHDRRHKHVGIVLGGWRRSAQLLRLAA